MSHFCIVEVSTIISNSAYYSLYFPKWENQKFSTKSFDSNSRFFGDKYEKKV